MVTSKQEWKWREYTSCSSTTSFHQKMSHPERLLLKIIALQSELLFELKALVTMDFLEKLFVICKVTLKWLPTDDALIADLMSSYSQSYCRTIIPHFSEVGTILTMIRQTVIPSIKTPNTLYIQYSLHACGSGFLFPQRQQGSRSTLALKLRVHYLSHEPLPLISLISVVCSMYVWWGTLEYAQHIVFYSEEPPFPDGAFSTAAVCDPLMRRHGWK